MSSLAIFIRYSKPPSGIRPLYCFHTAGNAATSTLQATPVIEDHLILFYFITLGGADKEADSLLALSANLILQPDVSLLINVVFV